MSKVALVKCDDYHQEKVNQAVEEALLKIGGLDAFVKPGQKVLLKVNALTPRTPDAAVTTHPSLIKAMIEEVRRVGGIPLVGDSSGGMIAGQSPTKQTFHMAGIAKAVEEAQAELVNFDTNGVVAVDVKGPIPQIHVAKPVLDADVVITMPKLKTHSAAVFTGAIKNMYGCIPGFRKAEYHRLVPRLRDFAELLVDIFQVAKPTLAIMDAVVGMEGAGPSGGNPRKIGLIMASSDSVAVDAVASEIIGLQPLKVHTTAVAHRRGLGQGELDNIQIIGEDLNKVKISDYDIPSNIMMETLPGFLISGLLGTLRAVPDINNDICVGCKICVENCPVEAMAVTEKYPQIDYNKCIQCLCCQELCPKKAVYMKQKSLVGKLMARMYESKKKSR